MGLIGMILSLALLIGLAFRGWSVLVLAPLTAMVAALFSGYPLLASWTQLFMVGTADFLGRFFPLFLLGAIFGRLMNDSGSVRVIADTMIRWLGTERAILAVVLAGALVTYGGVSLFVAFFVLVPMAREVFIAADIPRRLMPAAIVLGTSTFTMSALPGSPAIQNAIPMPFFGTTPFAAPGLGLIAAATMFGLGMLWLSHACRSAQGKGEGFSVDDDAPHSVLSGTESDRSRGALADEFDLAEAGEPSSTEAPPSPFAAFAPLVVVTVVNLVMSLLVLPRMDLAYLAEPEWGSTFMAAVAGVWSVIVALAAAIVVLILLHRARLPRLRDSVDAGAHASVIPALSVACLAGFGSVIAALPPFHYIREQVLAVPGGPVVSLAVATNVLAGLTGSASGGLTIALDAMGSLYKAAAEAAGINPSLLHRVAAIGSGTLDMLPHNGAIVTLLGLCGATHRESYRDIVAVGILPPIVALLIIIPLGALFGSF
ncbi:GntP family permease [Dyella solisilvae]|uniref:GntP family permease n=1 Tax=Dyella solisilvae TaxID=1920168 RepID=A0A370K516_9GAMM|nr:GntP family permease [Dyella solisilvae]